MKSKLLAALMAACVIFTVLSLVPTSAFAAEQALVDVTKYTDVLEDLQKDESFDVADYPIKPNSNAIEVFQIAESSDKELFVYVYQHNTSPSCNATSINISTSIGENLSHSNYELQLLSQQDTLGKYLVKDFTVEDFSQRFYDISGVFRKWDSAIDKEADKTTENKTSEVAFTVGKRWKLQTTDDGVTEYTVEVQDVLELKDDDVHVGNLVYRNMLTIAGTAAGFCSSKEVVSHYIAFKLDLSKYYINQLVEAKVSYTTTNWTVNEWIWDVVLGYWSGQTLNYQFEEPVSGNEKTLTHEDPSVKISTGGLFSQSYEWKRIQKAEDFRIDPDISGQLTAEAQQKLRKMQWVLRFDETELNIAPSNIKFIATGTYVSDVTILNLTFVMHGKTFQLGVVTNKVTATGHDNVDDVDKLLETLNSIKAFVKENWRWIVIALGIIIVIIVLGVLSAYIAPFRDGMKVVLKGAGVGLKWVGKCLYYAISAFPRLLVVIGNAIKERQDEKG